MKLTILGCGTSTGVPVIGCRCEVCTSPDPRNRRTRSSALIESRGRHILVDTSTDLRAQALGCGLARIDAVLFTHCHADHVHGIDDLRAFNHAQGGAAIPCYGNERTIRGVRKSFEYIFRDNAGDGWKPSLTTSVVEGDFTAAGVEFTPIDVIHGRARILGFRSGNAAYVTDCSELPDESVEKLRGVDALVLGALRHTPHPTHFNIEQALAAVERIRPGRAVLTHLGHNLDYTVDNDRLPDGVELAYDGMVIEV